MWSLQIVCVLITFIAIVALPATCDFYTSVAGLEDLLKTETYVVQYFENYLFQAEMAQEEVEIFFENIDDKFSAMLDNNSTELYFENPLFAIKMIRRFLTDWAKMTNEAVGNTYETELFDFLAQFENGTLYATNDDLMGAVKGLSRLQETYGLPTTEVAKGELRARKVSDKLSTSDCYQIGRLLIDLNNHKAASEWLLVAKAKLAQEKLAAQGNSTIVFHNVTETQVLELLAPVLSIIGSHKLAQKFNADLLNLDPTHIHALESEPIYTTNVVADRRREVQLTQSSNVEKTEKQDLYEKTCRGEFKRDPKDERNLFCRYAHNNVPFCFLARFKMEELSHDPVVAVYYDVIYDREIENIRNVTEDNVERSKVGNSQNSAFSDIRTSKNTWLRYESHSFLNNIYARLKDITGLSLESAEALQVANYGIGGHYGPHHDFFADLVEQNFGNKGNRILTALFYINHVDMGGSTAFPYLRLAVPPVKGSLVMWYNMHESLEGDYRTLHAGCPVLKGSKWICNEWFHESGQEFNRPCSLQKMGHKSESYKEIQLPTLRT